MHKRVIVIDVSEARDELQVLINPEILSAEGEAEQEEGCLSVPGYYDKVKRAARITRARAGRATAKPFELAADGLLAVCIQHEMDHLLGKVFVDYLSPLKRARLAARLRKKQQPGRLAANAPSASALPQRCASALPARRYSPRGRSAADCRRRLHDTAGADPA